MTIRSHLNLFNQIHVRHSTKRRVAWLTNKKNAIIQLISKALLFTDTCGH